MALNTFRKPISKSKLARPPSGKRFFALKSNRLKIGALISCCRVLQSPVMIVVQPASLGGAMYGLVVSGPPQVAAFEPVHSGWPVGLVTSIAHALIVLAIRSCGRL